MRNGLGVIRPREMDTVHQRVVKPLSCLVELNGGGNFFWVGFGINPSLGQIGETRIPTRRFIVRAIAVSRFEVGWRKWDLRGVAFLTIPVQRTAEG